MWNPGKECLPRPLGYSNANLADQGKPLDRGHSGLMQSSHDQLAEPSHPASHHHAGIAFA
jgi:hypothetical protein